MTIEVTWIVIPLLLMMGVFAWGANVYFTQQRPPTGALEINVIGKQWMWKVQHPEGNREINELHVPVGRNVKLTLASQDVITVSFSPPFAPRWTLCQAGIPRSGFKPPGLGSITCFAPSIAARSIPDGWPGVRHGPRRIRGMADPGKSRSTLAQAGERRSGN